METGWPTAAAALPASLRHAADEGLTKLREACTAPQLAALERMVADGDRARALATLLACSSFAAQLCQRHPDWLLDAHAAGSLQHSRDEAGWRAHADSVLATAAETPAETFDATLRQFRNREMLRILWRDFNRLAGTAETTADISRLAECAIDAALAYHHPRLCAELGTPVGPDGQPQHLVVLGMGKLGAGELNLSSDIDLIFAYPHGGETLVPAGSPSRRVANQEFFTRLGQRLIKSMDAVTADGFVFRVDMRLRPYGDSGALVLSFDAMEEYYQDQGRDWERYAMIKARAVAGDTAAGAELLATLRPFVYRRYLDFSAFDALRDMKRMIQREVQRRSLQDNIKLGAGGIREIEFIVQCFQLIRGGRDRVLQERRLQSVLSHLEQLGYLPSEAVSDLRAAYDFLRDTEHAIQGWLDRQTQELPTADLPRMALAHVMGFADWAAFKTELDAHRARVESHFRNVIASPEEDDEAITGPELESWRGFWLDAALTPEEATERLATAGHENALEAARLLLALRSNPVTARMQTVGRERLDAFMPQLLAAVTAAERPSEALIRILPLVEAVVRRTAYLVLLVENPSALHELVVLCAASPWIAAQLARHPVLLDELLDTRTLYHAPDKAELRDDLRQQMLRIGWEDLEAQMEQLRYFKQAHVLRVIAAEVTGRLPLMKVSDYLTWLAETILEHVLELAWRHLVNKHGVPSAVDSPLPRAEEHHEGYKGPEVRAETRPLEFAETHPEGYKGLVGGQGLVQGQPTPEKHFLIIGYGKLGGIELSHSSDLDLVFIHDADPSASTDGPNPIDGATFYTRLGQRIIHILTTQTALGPLYEVDMRLRPSGNSGLLVSTFKAFAEYQHNSAWTWEHQALVRARPVAGDERLATGFQELRKEVLCKPRDLEKLRRDVVAMREKMRAQLGSKEQGVFDLKQSPGGIVDIEFLVQYLVLASGGAHPALAAWTDNIRLLEALREERLVTPEAADELTAAYKVHREQLHRLGLERRAARVAATADVPGEAAVTRHWAAALL